jgi:hypothetical protein
VPGWVSDLLIIVGLVIAAIGIVSGNRDYDFFYGVQYVLIHVSRTTMLWVGGLTVVAGIVLRMMTESRPRKRRKSSEEYY